MERARKLKDTTEGSAGFLIGFLDSHPLISESMCSLLKEQEPSVSVVSAPRPDLLLDALKEGKGTPNIIIIHIDSVAAESERFVVATDQIRSAFPDVPVCLLSDAMNRDDLLSALEAGANCYFNTGVSAGVLCYLLRLAACGDVVGVVHVCAERLARKEETGVAPLHRPRKDGNDSVELLATEHNGLAFTVRESQILPYLANGTSNKLIGANLGVRESTVKVHVHNIMKKFGARNRTELAVMLLQDRSPADALGRKVDAVDGQA